MTFTRFVFQVSPIVFVINLTNNLQLLFSLNSVKTSTLLTPNHSYLLIGMPIIHRLTLDFVCRKLRFRSNIKVNFCRRRPKCSRTFCDYDSLNMYEES